MDCKDCRHDMWPYLKNELADKRVFELLEHVDSCQDCKNDLKIHFFVSEGISRLEDNRSGYNLLNDFEERLTASRTRCEKLKYNNLVVNLGSVVLLAFVTIVLVSSLLSYL